MGKKVMIWLGHEWELEAGQTPSKLKRMVEEGEIMLEIPDQIKIKPKGRKK